MLRRTNPQNQPFFSCFFSVFAAREEDRFVALLWPVDVSCDATLVLHDFLDLLLCFRCGQLALLEPLQHAHCAEFEQPLRTLARGVVGLFFVFRYMLIIQFYVSNMVMFSFMMLFIV